MPYILVLEREPEVAQDIAQTAEAAGYAVGVVQELKQVLLVLQQRSITALVIDLVMYESALEEIQQATTQFLPVIGLTTQDSACLKDRIQQLGLVGLLNRAQAKQQIAPLFDKLLERFYEEKYQLSASASGVAPRHFVGQSVPMKQLYFEIERVAKTNVPVLIVGESGTGKELVALALHQQSARTDENFLPLNCGAISNQLIESELFGHEKGSFTGADKARQGFFELATKGTLFLDEITEMPAEMQVRLLRVLETGQYMRVGGTKVLTTEARIVAATNREPKEAIDQEKLREDLFYRLNVFPIYVPPLRERGDDIWLLALYFLEQMNVQQNTQKVFAEDTQAQLMRHSWPGNVRELRNAVWRSYILVQGNEVELRAEGLGEPLKQ